MWRITVFPLFCLHRTHRCDLSKRCRPGQPGSRKDSGKHVGRLTDHERIGFMAWVTARCSHLEAVVGHEIYQIAAAILLLVVPLANECKCLFLRHTDAPKDPQESDTKRWITPANMSCSVAGQDLYRFVSCMLTSAHFRPGTYSPQSQSTSGG